MAWWSKDSDKILEKIEDKKEEIKECKTIKMRISSIGDLINGVPDKLNLAYDEFYSGGYLDNGKSIETDNMNGTGKSRILLLKEDVEDILERIPTFKNKVEELILKKRGELKSLEQQYREALRREREEAKN